MAQTHRFSITIDHTKLPADLVNFTVPIILTDANLKSVANGGLVADPQGRDIRVYSDIDLTTPVLIQKHDYDPTTGRLLLLFKGAALSSAVNPVFYMGVGDAALNVDVSDTGVWDASTAVACVFGTPGALSLVDSKNGYNLTNDGGNVVVAAGVSGAGGAASFANSATNRLYTAQAAIHTGKRTVTVLTKLTALAAGGHYDPLVKFSGTAPTSKWEMNVNYTGKVFLVGSGGGNAPANIGDGAGAATLVPGTVYHIAVSHDTVAPLGESTRQYVDGALDAVAGYPGFGDVPVPTADILLELGYEAGDAEYLNGLIGLFRSDSVARAPAWIAADAAAWKAPGTFLALGAPVSLVPAVVAPTPGFSVVMDLHEVTVTNESVAGTNPIVSVLYDYYTGEDGKSGNLVAAISHDYADDERGEHFITQYVSDGVAAVQTAEQRVVTVTRWRVRGRAQDAAGRFGSAVTGTIDRPDAV